MRKRKWLTVLITVSLMGFLPALPAIAVTDPDDSVFISEIHYDNDGTDAGESIEIFGPDGTNLTGWSVVRYNGSNGTVYGTDVLAETVSGGFSDFGVVVLTYGANGIQNGAPDGVALVDDSGVVRQFLSYEGVLTATDGPAAGLTSTDIGVSESGSTPVGYSLQLAGAGSCYGDLAWTAPAANTFGTVGPIVATDACEGSGGGGGGDLPAVRMSEIHYDNSGSDVGEAAEIFGPAGTDLTGWTLVGYNGNGGGVYGTVTLSGAIPDLDAGSGVVAIDYPANGLQNGSPDGLALVDASGAVVEFLSYEGIILAVGGPADGLTSTDLGVSETSSTLIGLSLQRAADGVWGGPFCASFGEINDPEAEATCPSDGEITLIHDIQGSGAASPILGQRVTIEGVVVGDHEGPAPALRGFFVQEEDVDADSDPLTSEGIFVFNFNNDDVDVGDVVQVEGTVAEFRGGTQLTDFVLVEVLDVEPRVASAAVITFPVAAASDVEAFEGMLVTLPQTMVISEYFNYDRFGDVVIALPVDGEDRPYNPTSLFDPDSAEAAARLDLNLRSRITIDDANSFSNPSDPIHPINRELFSLENTFRGGDQVTGLTGPMFESFGAYRVLPYAEDGYESYVKSDRDLTPADVGGDLKVATLNALNYFLTLDGNGPQCGPDNGEFCRGADNAGELERQRVKLLNALEGLDADVVGLVELENTIGVEALADLVNGLNDRLGAGTYDYVAAGTDSVVGDDVIKNGVIYKPGSVTQVGDTAILDTPAFLDPNNLGDSKNRAVVGVTFMENSSGEVFSVAVNHLKSKGSGCGAGDDHPLAGSCNLTRTMAAQALADWIATSPTGIADNDWMIIGDLNSYDQEAPITALADAGYTDLVAQFQGELAYSFVFDGQYGYLDYVMSGDSLTSQVTGATVWHINADEPDILDYDTSFKSTYSDGLFEPDNAFRSSDHDAVLVGLSLNSGITVTAEPDKLWSPNHKLNAVEISATDPAASDLYVLITEVVSSEADSGLGDEDVPNDINVLSDNVVELRSERFSTDGRTYTVYVMVSGDGQVVFSSVDVEVDHDQRDKPKNK